MRTEFAYCPWLFWSDFQLAVEIVPGTPTGSTQPFAEQKHDHFLNYFGYGYSLGHKCPECFSQVMFFSKEDGQLHASPTLV